MKALSQMVRKELEDRREEIEAIRLEMNEREKQFEAQVRAQIEELQTVKHMEIEGLREGMVSI